MGEIVASSETEDSIVEEITITYTAEGQIKGIIPGITHDNRLIKIRVPIADGWSPPSRTAEAAGYYTVMHEKPDADADTGYSELTGKVEAMDPGKANADDADPTYIVVRVLPEQAVEKGERLIISYQNAVAPVTPGKSEFVVFFDDGEADRFNVVVRSAAGAAKLAIDSDDSFIIDDGGALTVTVKLHDAEDRVATRDVPTSVTLDDGGAGGSFDPATVTIDAFKYMGTSTYTAAMVDNVTITATATGLTDPEPLTVLADTNNPSIDADSITATPMYAKAGIMVTVSATGTRARAVNTVTFSIRETDGTRVIATDRNMEEDEDEPGTYSGKTASIPDGGYDGTYNIIVEIQGTDVSVPATGALTIDTVLPVITDPSRGDETHVKAGDMVTVSATVSEASTVSADVSGLNADESPLSLEDADGDGHCIRTHGR